MMKATALDFPSGQEVRQPPKPSGQDKAVTVSVSVGSPRGVLILTLLRFYIKITAVFPNEFATYKA
jgi:hypothetical protein